LVIKVEIAYMDVAEGDCMMTMWLSARHIIIWQQIALLPQCFGDT